MKRADSLTALALADLQFRVVRNPAATANLLWTPSSGAGVEQPAYIVKLGLPDKRGMNHSPLLSVS